jgi:hypothetical protein
VSDPIVDKIVKKLYGDDLFDSSGRCRVCGHLEGDHERFPGTDTWTCDDDCDEDLNGYCHVGRL